MLNKEFFERETNISAKIICDSISQQGQRITTFEVEAPRIILAEINTHNALSKNCSSTRAITLAKAIEQIEQNGFTPLYWGKKQGGMAAEQEVTGRALEFAPVYWEMARNTATTMVKVFDNLEIHKQIAGRLLEPFQMVKQVLTATDLDNFFNLRIHPEAQPEILMLAYKMYNALQESPPTALQAGEWHTPYIERERDQYTGKLRYFQWDKDVSGTETDGYMYEISLTLEQAQRISASCCAQVSYRNTDNSLDKADTIFDRLIHADVLHASPFEHLATPVQKELYLTEDTGCSIELDERRSVNVKEAPTTWEKGITHLRRDGSFGSGNLRNWISYRHLMEGNTCWKYNHEERMKLFEV